MKAGRIVLLVLLFASLAAPLYAATVSGIAAVVNDRVITTHQLDVAVAATLDGKSTPPPLDLANLRSQVLDQLIEDSLVEQKIATLGLKVDDQEVDAALRDVQEQNHLTREQLVAALQAQGMPFDTYKEHLRKQILRLKLVGKEVQSKVEVTNQDTLDYFREHINDYRQAPTMRLGRITFPAAAKAATDAARKRLLAGEDLDSVLKTYADKGATGGDMGMVKDGELAPVFDQAIKNLQQGGVSDVVTGPDGKLYLFKVDQRTPGSIRKYDTVKSEIEHTLLEQKRQDRFKEWVQALRKEAYIDIRI